MKIEFKPIVPTPPIREVVITLSVGDAKTLHNELYRLRQASPAGFHIIDKLVDALTESHIQNT